VDVATLRSIGRAVGSPVVRTSSVTGGDVATSSRLELVDGRSVFAKLDARGRVGWASTEAWGLRWLAEGIAAAGVGGTLAVPEVVAVHDGDDTADDTADDGRNLQAHLVLGWIDAGGQADDAALGSALAAVHAVGAPCFGREDRRTTGSRGLPNDPCDTWPEFYATRRLAPLARIARDAGALPPRTLDVLERLADPDRLAAVGGPPEPPARLHGDLWAGNRVVGADRRHWLVDPAAHGGHREFDLSMMRLFGGFGPSCFDAYAAAAPLADGWADRVALHQVAPLVVHAVKFGDGYVRAAAEAVSRYA
jgi:fructosamine-3-kinase